MVYATLEEKYKNYAQTRRNNWNSGRVWSAKEIEHLEDESISDRELSKLLGRSVQSIQVKRSKLKTGYVYKI